MDYTKAVLDYLDGGNWKLAAEFVEVESGKRTDRPQLTAALAACKKLKARLVIAVAEHEREAISARTKAALAAAKARGVKLGGPNLRIAQLNGAKSNKAKADRFAVNALPIIRDAQKAGASSLRAIAKVLNDRAVHTARGGKWAAPQVRDILRRSG